jgi:steroid 5-alpha reductase family enzyme
MTRAFAAVALAYVVGLAVAVVVAMAFAGHTWLTLLAADLAATVVVFGFSVARNNSSVYDPYWSVAPIAIALWLASTSSRALIVIALVIAWGLRLTWNWARGWRGYEDWRYADYRAKVGRAYWLVSLFGFHLMPTLWVYAGSLALFPALSSARPLEILDAVAFVVTAGAIAIETIADQQLRAFRKTNQSGAILATGLWRWSRHPNYLGEIGFWWGLYLFAVAADRSMWWLIFGPLSINVLFVAISVPLLDRRSIARRPEYAAHMALAPALLPRWRRACKR